MNQLISQVGALKASVQQHTTGTKCDELLSLLRQFEERCLELTTDAGSEATEDALLLIPKVEISDISMNADDSFEGDGDLPAVDLHSSTNSGGGIVCKLCEMTDNVEKRTTDANGFSGPSVDGAKAKSYENWRQLSDHIQEVHSIFNNNLVEKDGFAVNGKRLLDSAGAPIDKASVLAKYSAVACPRCESLISLGASFKNGYTKLCYHLFVKHQETLPPYIPVHQCSLCSYSSHSGTLLSRHVEYNHSGRKNKNNQKVSCPTCKKFVLQRFLAKHLAVNHGVGFHKQAPIERLTCHICSKEISGKTNLTRHIQRMHTKSKELLCQWCSCQFYERKQLLNHMFAKHQANPYDKPVIRCQAPGCDFASLTNDSVLKHFATCHDTVKPHVCTQCGKSFKTRHNLCQHVTVMHPSGAEKYQCPQCSFSSHAQQYMKRHMKIHSDTKKHRCTFPGCTYVSHFSENVRKHSKVHSWHHKAGTNAKRDHSYIRRTRKRVATATTTNADTSATREMDKQPLPAPAVERFGADVEICSEAHPSAWTVDGKTHGMHGKEQTTIIHNAGALHGMAGEGNSQPMYACQQQYEVNNYISL